MASASARVQRSQLRLEAILSDLSEAVVVCTSQHRVVLFNHAAIAMLGAELGLNRTITKVIEQQSLRDALAELYRQHELRDAPGRMMFECGFGAGKRAVAHVHLLHEADGAARGYVLCLGGRGAPAPIAPQAARPFYYDFDLFDTDASPALRELALEQLDCVVFDTETTGLQPSSGDQIVQLAGVRVVNGTVLRAEVFDRLANPAMAIPPASTRIHGITDAMVSDAAPVAEVVRDFHLWTDRQVLVAHNAAFDMRFLQLQHESSGVSFEQPVLDSLLLSVLLSAQEQNHTLDALMRRLGVQMDPELRHTALGDAIATAEVFAAMLAPLAARGIRTVGQALDESAKLFAIRREQQKF
jgi:DNA polymerase-3 subunit epsilon